MPGSNLLALDVGDKRLGLAVARAEVRVPISLPTLERDGAQLWQQLRAIIKEYDVNQLVVGLPRGLDGQDTAQTRAVQTFAEQLNQELSLPIAWQDEALTSVAAEEHLQTNHQPHQKGDVDAMAATLILNDYLNTEEVRP